MKMGLMLVRHENKKQILPKENTCFFIDDDNRTLLNLYQPFVVLWIGVDYLLPFSIVVLLCIYFYLYCLVDINEVLKEYTGVWEQERILAIVEATAITIGITVLMYLICSEIPSGNFSGMFLRICAAVLVPACLFLVCYRNNAQLRLFFGMLSSFLKKWKKKQKKV